MAIAYDSKRRSRSYVLSALVAAGAAGVLAACGGSGGGLYGSGGSGSSAGASASTGGTLASQQLSGVGTVLVDQSGKTVYMPDQEGKGMIKCTGGCLSFWFPVTVASASGKPSLPSGFSGAVSTIKRPDNGQMQVTYDGTPLYTFKLDQAPGEAKGNNFQDAFNGTAFTWRAVSTATRPGSAPSGAPSSSGSGGYGTGGYGGK